MAKSYRHLTHDQRCQIHTLKERGDSPAEIARVLGVHRSTIIRELKRNSGARGYAYEKAHQKAMERRKESHCLKMTPKMITLIEKKIRMNWSPEQIAGWMKKHETECVSYETIYKHIWADKKKGGTLYKHLRHSGKKYNRRSKGTAGRGCIPGRIDIKERPKIVEEKTRIGDWEGDTVIGLQGHSVLTTLVDRATKLVCIKKSARKTTNEVIDAMIAKLNPLQGFTHTVTLDNGKEFSGHERLSEALGALVFFATPYHSWERGLNEHTNGLVRQYLPKGTNFDDVSKEDIENIEAALNNRPRKSLGFETPLEAFQRLTKVEGGPMLSM